MSSNLQRAVQQFFTEGADREVLNRATAETQYQAALATTPWLAMTPLSDRVTRVIEENASRRSRLSKLRALVDEAASAVAPYTPCRKGCSQCCHIPVHIFAGEAEAIAAATGRPAAKVPSRNPADLDKSAHMGEACPFLVDHACSIYAVRPLACRLHHTLDTTPAQCDLTIPSAESSVPSMASFRWFELGYSSLVPATESIGDIREFFPVACEK